MQLAEMTWPAVGALSRDMPVILPVAALEQHGRHMPLFTDSLLCGEVVRRALLDPRVAGRVLVAPLTWLGNSHHHMDFPGTLSAEPRMYLDLLVGLAENVLAHGFRRIVFLNGHGGNDVPGRQAVFEVRQRHRATPGVLAVFATYWLIPSGEPPLPPPGLEFVQRQMGHACEWETSMMLRLRPDLVGDFRNAPSVPFGRGVDPAHRGWTMPDRSDPGHIGDPRAATADKGEHLFNRFAGDAAALLQRVIAWNGRGWDA